MKKITMKLASFKEMLQNAWTGLKEAWETEPVVVLTTAASIITFIAAKFGIAVNEHSLAEALKFILPILGLGIFARKQVTPVAKLAKQRRAREHRHGTSSPAAPPTH